jgi:hypothetical protein
LAGALVAMPAPLARCTVVDPRLAELSGLVSEGTGLWAMADGNETTIHRIDQAGCRIAQSRDIAVGLPGLETVDTEDLARGPNGTIWIGDIGDNGAGRGSISVIEVPADGPARWYRLRYPDGPHDAEALLVDPAGRPIVVTKDVGPAGIYRTDARPDGAGPTPLTRVGTLDLPDSDTVGGPLDSAGRRTVTGAASSVDARVVAVRTYTDAWLFRVPASGDPVEALAGRPVRVPLPGEPQGEAITFDAEGTLLSGSETRHGVLGAIRAVPGAVALALRTTVGSSTSAGPPTPAGERAGPDWLPAMLGAGVAAAVLLLLTALLALRSRRR